MSAAAQALYRILPYPAKTLAASVHGYRLHRWCYGPETDGLVEEAVERESWSGKVLCVARLFPSKGQDALI